ncbi:GIY-YIG nuclease family protein [Aliiglaciecola sp. 3_MG-2023]|uniref:GIY-YIG nuclease family protein n=1 Tax=Aliiglaciecola sp. 3_MG-2023 TaxID=3062644 RepID=UPI0026E44F0A|nr:GIY-YIG nuclease family protein [Aliiglaciecola sp. 3_MG-2023]MDO6691894.1 GIY-YIG nuclease family protein [Aliiglaciecola sp. 3_MG-2023]
MADTKWFIYVVENRLGMTYCGICTDLARRFHEHASNSKRCAKALRGKGPLKLKFAAQMEGHSNALKTEYWFKKQSKTAKLKIINGEVNLPSNPIKVSPIQLQNLQSTVEERISKNASSEN